MSEYCLPLAVEEKTSLRPLMRDLDIASRHVTLLRVALLIHHLEKNWGQVMAAGYRGLVLDWEYYDDDAVCNVTFKGRAGVLDLPADSFRATVKAEFSYRDIAFVDQAMAWMGPQSRVILRGRLPFLREKVTRAIQRLAPVSVLARSPREPLSQWSAVFELPIALEKGSGVHFIKDVLVQMERHISVLRVQAFLRKAQATWPESVEGFFLTWQPDRKEWWADISLMHVDQSCSDPQSSEETRFVERLYAYLRPADPRVVEITTKIFGSGSDLVSKSDLPGLMKKILPPAMAKQGRAVALDRVLEGSLEPSLPRRRPRL